MLLCHPATLLLSYGAPHACEALASAMLAPSRTPKQHPQALAPSLTPHPKPKQVLLSLARAGHVAEALRLLDAASARGVHLAPSVHEERELWVHCLEHGVQDDAPPQYIRVAAGRSLAAA